MNSNKDGNKIIMLLGLAGFMVMADNWVVSPILPAISQNLDIDISRAGLLITAYMIPFGIFQIIFGPLADRYGKKQVITSAMIIFTIATGLCALGSSLTSLSIFRALTGVFCRIGYANFPRFDRGYVPCSGKTGCDRNVYGYIVSRARTQYGHRRLNCLLL